MNLTPLIESIYLTRRMVFHEMGERCEMRYKPMLLLALLDQVYESPDGKAWWNEGLRTRYREYYELLKRPFEKFNLIDPYWRMDCMGWRVYKKNGDVYLAQPKISDFDEVYGMFSAEATEGIKDFYGRERIREAIINRFFPEERGLLQAAGFRYAFGEEIPWKVAETPEVYQTRSVAFSKMVKEIYDNQCVACGQRIMIPEVGSSFVDAAHLIPFSETQDDRPSNGIALCKNHHWAMDRRIIAPTPEMIWEVSPLLLGTRSRGEEALLSLKGAPVLPPQRKDGCAPSREALAWRLAHLLK